MHIRLQRCWMDSDSEYIFCALCPDCVLGFMHLSLWTYSRLAELGFCIFPLCPLQPTDSAFSLRCAVPAGTQPIRTSAPFLKNNQQPIRTSTLSNSYLAAVQEGLISPSQNNPSHHWYLPHTSTLTWGERQWQVWFNVRLNCY